MVGTTPTMLGTTPTMVGFPEGGRGGGARGLECWHSFGCLLLLRSVGYTVYEGQAEEGKKAVAGNE